MFTFHSPNIVIVEDTPPGLCGRWVGAGKIAWFWITQAWVTRIRVRGDGCHAWKGSADRFLDLAMMSWKLQIVLENKNMEIRLPRETAVDHNVGAKISWWRQQSSSKKTLRGITWTYLCLMAPPKLETMRSVLYRRGLEPHCSKRRVGTFAAAIGFTGSSIWQTTFLHQTSSSTILHPHHKVDDSKVFQLRSHTPDTVYPTTLLGSELESSIPPDFPHQQPHHHPIP